MTTWNSNLAKQILRLSHAGEEQNNPILTGLPLQIRLRFNQVVYALQGHIGTNSPPTTSFTFVQDEEDAMLFKADLIAGEAPFQSQDVGTRNNIRVIAADNLSNSQVVWEKKLYMANLPDHAVQVYARVGEWTSVNSEELPSIPLCCQMCPIRFFSGWYDAFENPGFGGAQYVSIFDQGSEENEESSYYVRRQIDQEIANVHFIYLEKHTLRSIEKHFITVRFKTGIGVDADGVNVNITVQSPECWGFEIQDPVWE